VILKNADLRFYSQGNLTQDLELRGLSAEIPVWGQVRAGELDLGQIRAAQYLADLEPILPLKWENGAIRIERQVLKVYGVDLELQASLRISRGLPFGLSLDLPVQQTDFSPLYSVRKTPLKFESLSSQNVFQINLLNPTSLSGRSVSSFKGLTFRDPKDGGDTYFDRGTALFKITAAGLVANDVRAIGDTDSILMNGFLTRGGEAAATVRVVSSPERASSHEKRIKGLGLPLELEFEPLLTPDREYHDFRLEAHSGSLMINLGADEKWVPFFPTARAIFGRSIQPKPPLP